jgi:hypothetical protein
MIKLRECDGIVCEADILGESRRSISTVAPLHAIIFHCIPCVNTPNRKQMSGTLISPICQYMRCNTAQVNGRKSQTACTQLDRNFGEIGNREHAIFIVNKSTFSGGRA